MTATLADTDTFARNYEGARAYLDRARDVRAGRPLENNTRLFSAGTGEHGDMVSVRLHRTNIVTYCADSSFILYVDGWHTMTTKYRLNSYVPFGRVERDAAVRGRHRPHTLVFLPDRIFADHAKWLRDRGIGNPPERVRAGRLLHDMVRVLPDGSIGEVGHRAAERVMFAAPYTLGR